MIPHIKNKLTLPVLGTLFAIGAYTTIGYVSSTIQEKQIREKNISKIVAWIEHNPAPGSNTQACGVVNLYAERTRDNNGSHILHAKKDPKTGKIISLEITLRDPQDHRSNNTHNLVYVEPGFFPNKSFSESTNFGPYKPRSNSPEWALEQIARDYEIN